MVAVRRFELPRTSCFEQVGSTIFPFVHTAIKIIRLTLARIGHASSPEGDALPLSYNVKQVVVPEGIEPSPLSGYAPKAHAATNYATEPFIKLCWPLTFYTTDTSLS